MLYQHLIPMKGLLWRSAFLYAIIKLLELKKRNCLLLYWNDKPQVVRYFVGISVWSGHHVFIYNDN